MTMSLHSEEEGESLSSLAQTIIQTNQQQASPKIQLSLAIAGGGSSAISTLTSTSGASSTFLSGQILYSRQSFASMVSQPQIASVLRHEGIEDYHSRSNKFGYCSKGASQALAQASLVSGMNQVGSGAVPENALQSLNCVVGVGCTSSLVSGGRMRSGRKSKAFISWRTGLGIGKSYAIALDNGGDNGEGNNNLEPRTREEEDQLVGKLILSSVLDSIKGLNPAIDNSGTELSNSILLSRPGDLIQSSNWSREETIESMAQTVIDPNKSHIHAAMVLPNPSASSPTIMRPLSNAILPSDPIIFPGSFNPPHLGHATLAKAAVKAMTRKKRMEVAALRNQAETTDKDLLDEIWNATEHEMYQSDSIDTMDETDQGPFPVLFEMSLTNADKPPMEAGEASRRTSLFTHLQKDQPDSLPKDWGVLLTSAPLFIDKVRLLNQYLAPSSAFCAISPRRKLTFVIGTDTMIRIINPKYYGGELESMLEAVRDMGREGAHFVVGGRVEQVVDTTSGLPHDTFVTGEKELKGLPFDVQEMFTIL
jgi:nicotinic acid mononucleotide adenylyltransferase